MALVGRWCLADSRGLGRDSKEEATTGDDEFREQQPAARTPATANACRPHQRRDACQLGVATKQGMCGMEGCTSKFATTGCKTCGYRFCMVSCLNKHLRGEGALKRLRTAIEWKVGEWYD